MALFIWIFTSLIVVNILLLVFSNSLRSPNRAAESREKADSPRESVYSFSAVESELEKAV
jgi:hypothetical protein